MTEAPQVFEFETRDVASAAAAAKIAGSVDAAICQQGSTAIVVSGGTTPAPCFDYLSGYDLDWKRVLIALSDERWVPNDHLDSNEMLINETLRVGKASAASVLSIYQDDMSVDEACDLLQGLRPDKDFACSLIGMGADGHFASLFPEADSLASGLTLPNDRFYLPVRTDKSPHPRISMTLDALLRSESILLLFFGDEKRAVYERAAAGDDTYPIATLLAQRTRPVSIYWAP